MHELSLAEAVLEIVRRHAPTDATVRKVRLEAGPMRGIDRDSMDWAWRSATSGTRCDGADLDLILLPWKMHCPECGRDWETEELFVVCECGCNRPHPVGGDELRVVSLDVDELSDTPESPEPPPATQRQEGASPS
ncbi:MAG: hydrogenase maturation nickel metallochaperone HypA [Phycisphaeraceae bacterium]|nr:hydrogenase maturation nickel metallochaperone HypA [Phycisphaeraceae bacterium]